MILPDFILTILQGFVSSPICCSIIVIVLIAITITTIVLLLFYVFPKMSRKGKVFLIILCAYLICVALRFFPYTDAHTHIVKPELVAKCESGTANGSGCETFYSISRFPFTLDSLYQRTYSESSVIEEWIIENTKDTEHYTYIISYGHQFIEIRYNIWNSYGNYLPIPWNGIRYSADFIKEGVHDSNIYIYRIPCVPIETVG